jgi:hypothetical protein
MTVDCWVEVSGVRFADTAGEWAAGEPTALADLTVTWGRADTVEQPDTATCTFSVLDRAGGIRIVDALPIGAPINVWASGDVSTGTPDDVTVDGSFELEPAGPTVNRAALKESEAPAVLVNDRARASTGVQALREHVESDWSAAFTIPQIMIPPAAFSTNPEAWDTIPRYQTGAEWAWAVDVWTPYGGLVSARPALFDGPDDRTWQIMTSVPYTGTPASARGTWYTLTGNTDRLETQPSNRWLGVEILVSRGTHGRWTSAPGTWAEQPGTWDEWVDGWVDNLRLIAPSTGLPRTALVFAGRITNVELGIDDDAGTVRGEVIAVDQSAELQNRYIGAQPWPAEPVAARLNRILTGLDVDQRIDPTLTGTVSWRDVDRQPAGGLISELAAGIDAVYWSAVHATTGPYVWLEDPANRAALQQLALSGSTVIIEGATGLRPEGRTHLDGCTLSDESITWARDVSDVVNLVDAAWREQTTDETGNPAPTDRTETVTDPAAVTAYGARRMGVTTNLTTAAAAIAVGNKILARTRQPAWRVNNLIVDAGMFPPAAGVETANLLDLLDGTIRCGRPLVFTNISRGPNIDTTGAYLDGGNYLFDGAWRLELSTTPMAGVGLSARWSELDPAWRWNQFDPTIAWFDLVGVAA